MKTHLSFAILAFVLATAGHTQAVDLIVHHGKIVSVDDRFTIHEAMAVTDGKITAIGRDEDILKSRTDQTQVVDLVSRLQESLAASTGGKRARGASKQGKAAQKSATRSTRRRTA